MNQEGSAPGRGGLGRGLDALIQRGSGGVQEIELARIAPNPLQPRQHFDEDALEELAASIREHGILQPVVVARAGAGYTLIAGERRWRAAHRAGLTTVPALVKEASARDRLELALVENLQRADLTSLEEASAYRTLLDEYGLTQEQVATRVGRSRVAVANRLRLLGLPPAVKALLAAGSLTEGHARALLGAGRPELIERLADEVVAEGLSVRDTEERVRRAAAGLPPSLTLPREGGGNDSPLPRAGGEGQLLPPLRGQVGRGGSSPQEDEGLSPLASRLSPLEEELQRALGTRVELKASRRGGKLVIHYYGDDQLEGLIELLLGRNAE